MGVEWRRHRISGPAQTPNLIAFATTVRFSEAFETFCRAYRARVSFWLIAFAVLAIVGMQLTPFNVQLLLWWGLGSVLALVSVWTATIVVQALHLARRSKANGGVRWEVRDDGLTIEAKNATVSVKWPAFVGFVNTKRLFLIRLKERRTYFIIPKRCLAAQLEPQLFDLLLQHLAKLSA
jgi:hypothetical protein